MQALTMSIAVVASAFILPFSNDSLIKKNDLVSNETKPAAAVQPATQSAVASASTSEPVQTPEPPVVVAVQPGDSLTKIANAHSTTSERLFFANTDIKNPDLIYPNQQLRIPKADEELAPRAIPQNQQIMATPQPTTRTQSTPQPAVAAAPAVADGSVWDRLAACESGGNWAINTGNGYYGGLQFSLSSWRGVGGAGYPHQASREEQIARGEALRARGGWGHWPACSSKLGLR